MASVAGIPGILTAWELGSTRFAGMNMMLAVIRRLPFYVIAVFNTKLIQNLGRLWNGKPSFGWIGWTTIFCFPCGRTILWYNGIIQACPSLSLLLLLPS
jgi:hypothetical protein